MLVEGSGQSVQPGQVGPSSSPAGLTRKPKKSACGAGLPGRLRLLTITAWAGEGQSMSFRVERATTDLWGCAGMATPTSGVASVEGAVKGGRSPAKRTLYCARNASTLKGLGLVAAFRGQPPSPSGGEDFPALGGGARGGGARRARHRHRPRSTRNDTNPGDALNQPFLRSLADSGAYLSNYYAVAHPSQPNYVALLSGSTDGVIGDLPASLDRAFFGAERT
jgi:hypothetical protein